MGATVSLALTVLLSLGATVAQAGPPTGPEAGDPSEGELLAGLAGCAACHTADDGVPYAGGHAVETTFGTFHGTNLTPDPEHGLGAWTFDDFERAMRHGRSPKGRFYWPAFPYTSFVHLTDAELRDLWAFLQTLPADDAPNRPHELAKGYGSRAILGLWRPVAFRKRLPPLPRDVDADDPVIARGRHLVEGPGHCAECHSPRNPFGMTIRRRHLGGSDTQPAPGPNLTPHADGLGSWSADDLDTFLTFGMTPEGDIVSDDMLRIVEEGTTRLPADDRAAIVAYLQALPPVPDP